jgi:small subunit ribosomal protein S30
MLKASRIIVFRQNLIKARQLSNQVQPQNDNSEISERAEYPAIVDTSYKAKKTREVKKWHEKIKRIGSIEEKLIEINIPRYYGYKCMMLDEKVFPYNTLPFFQYVTKTEFEEFSPAPQTNEVDTFLNLIRSDIQDAFEFELDGYK